MSNYFNEKINKNSGIKKYIFKGNIVFLYITIILILYEPLFSKKFCFSIFLSFLTLIIQFYLEKYYSPS